MVYTRTTTLRSDNSGVHGPSEGSEYIKVITSELPYDVKFNLNIKEFVEGKEVEDYLPGLLFGNYNKGNKIIFELVPDTANSNLFKLFTYHPECMFVRNKFPIENATFKYCKYQKTDEIETRVEIPVLFIYEDNVSDSNVETFINPFLVNNMLSERVAQEKNIYSKIRRYCIVSYTIEKL